MIVRISTGEPEIILSLRSSHALVNERLADAARAPDVARGCREFGQALDDGAVDIAGHEAEIGIEKQIVALVEDREIHHRRMAGLGLGGAIAMRARAQLPGLEAEIDDIAGDRRDGGVLPAGLGLRE